MKIRITTLLLALIGLFTVPAASQEITGDTLPRTVEGIQQTLDVLKRIKISGYIQTQFQVADSNGQASFAGGNFLPYNNKRFAIRRGRVKFQYDAPMNEKGISTSQYVLQFDVTEKGLNIKDAYAKFTDPWIGWLSLTAGMQNRPFGFEISYSSSLRESPERGRMSQIIFPNERDLGAMITLQGPKTSNWNWLKVDAGWFNGVGAPGVLTAANDFDNMKDFIGHITATRSTASEKIKYSIGLSYYDGGFRLDNDTVYAMGDSAGVSGFKIESSTNNKNKYYSERKYTGVDAQVSIDWIPGITTIRGEFIQGDQPAIYSLSDASRATTSAILPVTSPLFKRKFNGAYIYFLQNIGTTPLQAIVKYDWYDPNTDVKGNEIGKPVGGTYKATNASDIKYSTLGLGLAYRWDANVKLTAYWDKVTNETTENLGANSLYNHDLEDDVLTIRVQVKF